MSEEKNPATQVAKKNPGHRFEAGHPRWGGKKRNTAAAARAMAEEMGVDPLQFMLSIINSDVIEQTVIVDGKRKRVETAIPLDMRLDAAKTVVNYLYPRLNAQQITGRDDGPIESVALDITKLLQDPDAVEAAQRLALLLVEQDGTPAPVRVCGPAEMDLSKSPNGHWAK